MKQSERVENLHVTLAAYLPYFLPGYLLSPCSPDSSPTALKESSSGLEGSSSPRSKQQKGKAENPICSNCSVKRSPAWRRALDASGQYIVLCNACGLYRKRTGMDRHKTKLKKRRCQPLTSSSTFQCSASATTSLEHQVEANFTSSTCTDIKAKMQSTMTEQEALNYLVCSLGFYIKNLTQQP